MPIFYHNQMDLRGLAGLASRIVACWLIRRQTARTGWNFSESRGFASGAAIPARARKHYAQSLDAVLPAETDRAARRSLARLAKREGDLPLALKLWESMLGNSREGLEAYEQLAIYYERQAREPHRAAVLVRRGLGGAAAAEPNRRAKRSSAKALPE